MKHIICLCLVCVMIISLVGCNRGPVSPTIATVIPMEETVEIEPETPSTVPQIPAPSEEVVPAGTESQQQNAPVEEMEGTEASEHKHSYTSKVTKAPTCTNSGVITYTCKECGNSYSKILKPLDHAYIITKKAPDCVNSGGTTHRCSECGHTYTDNIQPALGHSYGPLVTVKNPTELLPGAAELTCTRCGEVERIELPPLNPQP